MNNVLVFLTLKDATKELVDVELFKEPRPTRLVQNILDKEDRKRRFDRLGRGTLQTFSSEQMEIIQPRGASNEFMLVSSKMTLC
jgi:hypothetical protein